nr:hypothetical protein [Tanacetum cinerariifolium]
MKGYIDNLERLGHPVTLGLGVSLILIGLRKEYDGFVQNYNMHNIGKTVNELHAMLKLHEQTLPKSNAPALNAIRAESWDWENKQAYAPKPKIPPPPKRENPSKDSICHECREIGHWKRNYPQCLAELMQKKKNTASGAGGSGIFVIELNTILNRSWIYDTGCGTHIYNTTQGLRASRKLKPGALSLYHCQLRLISKKRIEKLQHNGLLDSSDLMAFETCVSCMSGKMARKPYTHQVERAKDLLGLIHTDHKHEVFETFKVFQKEVENQLGKTIKLLCSDRGGEYMSQEFLDHLKDHGIIAHRTPPYTPPHNDVSKKRNITLLDMETIGYSFYYPPENKVLVARNAKFLENSLINQEASLLGHDMPQIVCAYKAALLDPESKKWLNPINVEMKSMKDNEVWVLVELPPNGKIIGNIRAIRILIDIATYYDYKIWQMDVKTAFLNGYLNEENQGDIYWTTVKNILKYLRNTKDMFLYFRMFLVYKGDLKRELRVSCYTDAGYLTDADDLKSQTGYVFVSNGGAVDWKSAKQSIFATSSAEAEYVVAFDASKEAVCVRKLISGLGVVPTIEEPISMYCDNTRAIAIANESEITKDARHFRAKVHYLREVIEFGDIKLEKVHTDKNLADPFTKALAFTKLSEHTRNIGMLPASSLM